MALDLTTLKAAAVDARGSACPGPLLEAKKRNYALDKYENQNLWIALTNQGEVFRDL